MSPAFGLSLHRWEPGSCHQALLTGLIDAVQVIHDISDQSPQAALFPAWRQYALAIFDSAPFDEGTPSDMLTLNSRWPEGEWRSPFVGPKNLTASIERAEALRRDLPGGVSMPDMAKPVILSSPDVGSLIPGMCKPGHVEANLAAAEAGGLAPELIECLCRNRWDRRPAL